MAKGLLKKPPPFVSLPKLYSKKIRDFQRIYFMKILLCYEDETRKNVEALAEHIFML